MNIESICHLHLPSMSRVAYRIHIQEIFALHELSDSNGVDNFTSSSPYREIYIHLNPNFPYQNWSVER